MDSREPVVQPRFGSTRPRISVCLLTYNRAKLLPRSIDSLLSQTIADFELIINDDCSTDDTAQVASRYVRADPRVKYYKNHANLRYAGNQNAALRRASGQLIAMVHDGDVYRRDCLQQWTDVMRKYENVGLVFNASDEMNERGEITHRHRHEFPKIIPGEQLLDEMYRSFSSPIFGIVMLRKALVTVVGPFDERYPVLADVDMWMRLLEVGDAAYINEPLYTISPREKNHINYSINWEILREQQQIFEAGLGRRFARKPSELIRRRRALQKVVLRRAARNTAACFKHRKWLLATRGLRYVTRVASSLLNDREAGISEREAPRSI